ncbi:MAG: hypothetical protein POELPBGB_02121 [Bacteroidia bacterium]|nr:hypothetical protein [Bacteroidia bacterium]
MKRIPLTFIILVVIVCFVGCAKSFITNTWKVDKFERNGVDETQSFQQVLFIDYKLTLEDGGDYVEYAKVIGIPTTKTGTWKFLNGNKNIELIEDGSNTIRNFECNKLTANEMVVTLYGNDTQKYYLSPK